MLSHGSLFAGFDGISRGFERAGIKTIWRIELLEGKDIRKEDPLDYERPDILSGGPPCVHTSQAAAWHQQRDYSSLWPEMLRFVEALRPKWVFLEQPKGGRVIIEGAAQDLQRLGYGCAGRIVDSRHWVPQTRSRWFLIGRMGTVGMDLWNRLYPDRQRVEGAHLSGRKGVRFDGNCPHCVRGGVYTRVSTRKPALMAAGNAVTEPVAEWIARRIIACE